MKQMSTRNIVWPNGRVGFELLSGAARVDDDELTGDGTVTLISKEILSMHQEHDTTLVTLRVTAGVDGILQGTLESNETARVHADGSVDVISTHQTFTGSVGGKSGTLELHEHSVIDVSGNITGHFEVVGGSGELAGARGRGSLRGANDTNNYQITLRF